MGKSKKRKTSSESKSSFKTEESHHPDQLLRVSNDNTMNPLFANQHVFLSTLTKTERDYYFSNGSSLSITPERRAEIWMKQADIGENLINQYAWATPTEDCIKIFRQFSPIVEIGCGSNAYWAKFMREQGGIDVVAYDRNVSEGGKILQSKATQDKKKRKRKLGKTNGIDGIAIGEKSSTVVLRKGGPEVLKNPELENHTLFLCYPDEEDFPTESRSQDEDESIEQEDERPLSFGWQCLNQYKGTYVIHVGELGFFDATLNMEQSPWGRSSSPEFQQRLASEFHCIAKLQLPNWLHVRDSISVWKRSEVCQMAFVGDEDDESEEIIEYRHIPPEELLPTNIVAPCLSKILRKSESVEKESGAGRGSALEKTLNDGFKEKREKNQSNPHDSTASKAQPMQQTKTKSASDLLSDKKTRRGKRRERQKQKKMMATQLLDEKSEKLEKKDAKEEKRKRSEYFRLHGKLPPMSLP